MLIMIGGGVEALSIAIAVFMVLTRRAWAAQAAIVVGFGTRWPTPTGTYCRQSFPVSKTASSLAES